MTSKQIARPGHRCRRGRRPAAPSRACSRAGSSPVRSGASASQNQRSGMYSPNGTGFRLSRSVDRPLPRSPQQRGVVEPVVASSVTVLSTTGASIARSSVVEDARRDLVAGRVEVGAALGPEQHVDARFVEDRLGRLELRPQSTSPGARSSKYPEGPLPCTLATRSAPAGAVCQAGASDARRRAARRPGSRCAGRAIPAGGPTR